MMPVQAPHAMCMRQDALTLKGMLQGQTGAVVSYRPSSRNPTDERITIRRGQRAEEP